MSYNPLFSQNVKGGLKNFHGRLPLQFPRIHAACAVEMSSMLVM